MKSRGFSLISVIFIIAMLALIGAYMVHFGTIQNQTTIFSMQGIRAYYAAKSALEWGSATVVNNCGGVSCTTGCFTSPTTLTFSSGGLNGFTASVTCSAATFTEGNTYTLYTITATGQSGTLGNSNYVMRMLTQQIIN